MFYLRNFLKKVFAMILAFVMIFALSATTFADYDKITLKFGTSSGETSLTAIAFNEWGKRHNKEGKKRRFFEEWKW